MSTVGTSTPGQSASRFSPSPEQYTDGLPLGFVSPGTENLNPAEIFSGPGYTVPRPRNDFGAAAVLVRGLFSSIPLAGVAAIILGIDALRYPRHNYNSGEGLAQLGLILGITSVIPWLCLLIFILSAVWRSRGHTRPTGPLRWFREAFHRGDHAPRA